MPDCCQLKSFEACLPSFDIVTRSADVRLCCPSSPTPIYIGEFLSLCRLLGVYICIFIYL